MNQAGSQKIHFQEINRYPASYAGEEVIIRGFLYHTPEGETILAAEPHLKSCCLGSAKKILISNGEALKFDHRPITLQGKLFSESIGYRMDHASIVHATEETRPMITLAVCLILTVFVTLILIKFKSTLAGRFAKKVIT